MRALIVTEWYDLRRGNTADALNSFGLSFRISDFFEKTDPAGSLFGHHLWEKSLLNMEFDRLLESGLVPPEKLKDFVRIMREYPVYRINAINNLKKEYVYFKYSLSDKHNNDDNELGDPHIGYCSSNWRTFLGSSWLCGKLLGHLEMRQVRTMADLHDVYSIVIAELNKNKFDQSNYLKTVPKSISGYKSDIMMNWCNTLDTMSFKQQFHYYAGGDAFGKEFAYWKWLEIKRLPMNIAANEALNNLILSRAAVLSYYYEKKTLPADLNELVPGLLPEVPNDPFSGQPIKYDPQKNIVYSEGFDTKDDKGNERDVMSVINENSAIREQSRTVPRNKRENETRIEDLKDIVLHILPENALRQRKN